MNNKPVPSSPLSQTQTKQIQSTTNLVPLQPVYLPPISTLSEKDEPEPDQQEPEPDQQEPEQEQQESDRNQQKAKPDIETMRAQLSAFHARIERSIIK